MISVYLIEDHELYLEGLCLLLKQQADIEVVGVARNGNALLQDMSRLGNAILVMDVQLPDYHEEDLLAVVRSLNPQQKIIYLTLMRGTRYVHRLLRHNIQGYVLKNSPVDELLHAIRKVHGGGCHFSEGIDHIGREDFRNTITFADHRVHDILSKRELEILLLICREYTSPAIAETLFLSVSTIETHRKNIIAKLGVNNTVGLVRFALKHKLIE
jgi:two-component system response regulator NreC